MKKSQSIQQPVLKARTFDEMEDIFKQFAVKTSNQNLTTLPKVPGFSDSMSQRRVSFKRKGFAMKRGQSEYVSSSNSHVREKEPGSMLDLLREAFQAKITNGLNEMKYGKDSRLQSSNDQAFRHFFQKKPSGKNSNAENSSNKLNESQRRHNNFGDSMSAHSQTRARMSRAGSFAMGSDNNRDQNQNLPPRLHSVESVPSDGSFGSFTNYQRRNGSRRATIVTKQSVPIIGRINEEENEVTTPQGHHENLFIADQRAHMEAQDNANQPSAVQINFLSGGLVSNTTRHGGNRLEQKPRDRFEEALSMRHQDHRKEQKKYWLEELKPQTQAPFEAIESSKNGQTKGHHSGSQDTLNMLSKFAFPDSPRKQMLKKAKQNMQNESHKGNRDILVTSQPSSINENSFIKDQSQKMQNLDSSKDFDSDTSQEEQVQSGLQKSDTDLAIKRIDSEGRRQKILISNRHEIDGETERERASEMRKMILQWHKTDEFKRLGEKARNMVEQSFRNRQSHQSIFNLPERIQFMAMEFWPQDPNEKVRIPFYEKDFLEPKLKEQISDLLENGMKKLKEINKKGENIRKEDKDEVMQFAREFELKKNKLAQITENDRVIDFVGQLLRQHTAQPETDRRLNESTVSKRRTLKMNKQSSRGTMSRYLDADSISGNRQISLGQTSNSKKTAMNVQRSTFGKSNRLSVPKVQKNKDIRLLGSASLRKIKLDDRISTVARDKSYIKRSFNAVTLGDQNNPESPLQVGKLAAKRSSLPSLPAEYENRSKNLETPLCRTESVQGEPIDLRLHAMKKDSARRLPNMVLNESNPLQAPQMQSVRVLNQKPQTIKRELQQPILPTKRLNDVINCQQQTLYKSYTTEQLIKPSMVPPGNERNQEHHGGLSKFKTQIRSAKQGSPSNQRLVLPKMFVKSIVKQIRSQNQNTEQTLRGRTFQKSLTQPRLSPKVVMESDLVNPLTKQLRKIKRRSIQQGQSVTARNSMYPPEYQLEKLVSKLQEQAVSCGSPRNAYLSTQKSAKRSDEVTASQGVPEQARYLFTQTTRNSIASRNIQQTKTLKRSSKSKSSKMHLKNEISQTHTSTKVSQKKMRKFKLDGNKERMESFLNLVKDQQQNNRLNTEGEQTDAQVPMRASLQAIQRQSIQRVTSAANEEQGGMPQATNRVIQVSLSTATSPTYPASPKEATATALALELASQKRQVFSQRNVTENDYEVDTRINLQMVQSSSEEHPNLQTVAQSDIVNESQTPDNEILIKSSSTEQSNAHHRAVELQQSSQDAISMATHDKQAELVLSTREQLKQQRQQKQTQDKLPKIKVLSRKDAKHKQRTMQRGVVAAASQKTLIIQKSKEDLYQDTYLATLPEKDNKGRPLSGKSPHSVGRGSVQKANQAINSRRKTAAQSHESLAMVFDDNISHGLKSAQKSAHQKTLQTINDCENTTEASKETQQQQSLVAIKNGLQLSSNMKSASRLSTQRTSVEMLHLIHRQQAKPAVSQSLKSSVTKLNAFPLRQKQQLQMQQQEQEGKATENTSLKKKALSKFERQRNKYLLKMKTPTDADMPGAVLSFDAYKNLKEDPAASTGEKLIEEMTKSPQMFQTQQIQLKSTQESQIKDFTVNGSEFV